jgi:hypothetical protein
MNKQRETSAPSACQRGSSATRRLSWWRYRRVGCAGVEVTPFSSPAPTAVGLRKAFGPQTVLDGFDLEVPAGWLDLHRGFGHVHNHLDTNEHPGPSEDSVEVPALASFGDITIGGADLCDSGQGAA